jgi:hypothetical protein
MPTNYSKRSALNGIAEAKKKRNKTERGVFASRDARAIKVFPIGG